MFSHTKRISLELSNSCPYAGIHKKCPLSLVDEPVILPAEIVYDVLVTLGRHSFRGIIAFHTYNEPLVDPRLFQFIEFARKICPHSDLFIFTNGCYLNQTLADELVSSGVSRIRVSAYSRSELKRLSKIKLDITFSIKLEKLDDRLHLYEAEERLSSKPCFAPLNEIIIAREGCITLCCLDWKRLYTFGDLRKQTFEEVVQSGELQAVYAKLSKGDRFLPLCKRCKHSR